MLKFYRFATTTKRIFLTVKNQSNLNTIMESGFELPNGNEATRPRDFSRTPRKMSRDSNSGNFRTRTQSVASNQSNDENSKQVKNTSLYKTELCRSFEDTGVCRYGKKCQFAHSRKELRVLARHPKYKTDMCKSFHSTGFCPYGSRCHFIHKTGHQENEDDEAQHLPIDTLKISDAFEDAMKDTWNTKAASKAWGNSQSNSPVHSDNQSKSGNESDSKFSDSLKSLKFGDEIQNSPKFSAEDRQQTSKLGLAKTATFASLNSVGSFPGNSSLDSIWSNNNSSSNLNNFQNPWSDNYLPPTNEKIQNYENSSAVMDGSWGGLTFSVNQKPGGSLGGYSDRDSLSPPSDQYEKKEFSVSSWLPKSLADDIDSSESSLPRLSVFRSIFSSEK